MKFMFEFLFVSCFFPFELGLFDGTTTSAAQASRTTENHGGTTPGLQPLEKCTLIFHLRPRRSLLSEWRKIEFQRQPDGKALEFELGFDMASNQIIKELVCKHIYNDVKDKAGGDQFKAFKRAGTIFWLDIEMGLF